MVEFTITGDTAVCEVLGAHKLWAFKHRIEFALRNVRDVRRPEPGFRFGWWLGWRLPGTHIPGVFVAGSYYKDGKWTFCDVRRIDRAIIVELEHERYATLIVEVEDPERDVERLRRTAKLDQPPAARRR